MYTFATSACISNKGPMNIGPVSLFSALLRVPPVEGCLPFANFPAASTSNVGMRLLARNDSATNGGKVYESTGTAWVHDTFAAEGSLVYSSKDEAYFWLFPTLGCSSMLCRHITRVDEIRPDATTPVVTAAVGKRFVMDTSDVKFSGWVYTRRDTSESWDPTTGTSHASNYAALMNPFSYFEHDGSVWLFVGNYLLGPSFVDYGSLKDLQMLSVDGAQSGRYLLPAFCVVTHRDDIDQMLGDEPIGRTSLIANGPSTDSIVLKTGDTTYITFPPASLKKGMLIYDDEYFRVWSGSAWTTIPEAAASIDFEVLTTESPAVFFHWMRSEEKRQLFGAFDRTTADSSATYEDCYARIASNDPDSSFVVENAYVNLSVPSLGEDQATVSSFAIADFPISACIVADSSADGFYAGTEGRAVFEVLFDEKTGATPPARFGISSPGAFSVGWSPSYGVESAGVLLYVTSQDAVIGEAFFMSPGLQAAYEQAIDFGEV